MIDLSFSFVGECWLWQGGKASWYFVTLPPDKSEEIQFFSKNMQQKQRGWGAVRVQVTVGKTTWQTSIFPSFKTKDYILPIKADVRKKEKILVGNKLNIQLKIDI